MGARQSAHGRRRPAPAECGRASRRRKRCRWGIGNLGAILGFGGSLGAWAGGERHFGPDWRGSGAGVRIRMKFFGRFVFLSGPTDIHDISGVSAKFRRKCFPCLQYVRAAADAVHTVTHGSIQLAERQFCARALPIKLSRHGRPGRPNRWPAQSYD